VRPSWDIPPLPPWLGHLTGRDATDRAQRTHPRKGESLMLAGDEPGASRVDRAQKRTGTAVAVLSPEVICVHGLQHQPEPRARLGMPSFTGQDITHQAVRGLLDHQGLPRQGAGLHLAPYFEASLTRFKTVAIQHFHPIPWQPRGARPVKLGDQRYQGCRTIAHPRG